MNIYFDSEFYHINNTDLQVNYQKNDYDGLFMHWIDHGLNEGRLGSFEFDIHYCRMILQKKISSSLTPSETLEIFDSLTNEDKFVPVSWFNVHFFRLYCDKNGLVLPKNEYDVYIFYLENSWSLSLSPCGLFLVEKFIKSYDGTKTKHPFWHYINNSNSVNLIPGFSGAIPERDYILMPDKDKINIVEWYDELWYLKAYKDVHNMVRYGRYSCGLEHFLTEGFTEGRIPRPTSHVIEKMLNLQSLNLDNLADYSNVSLLHKMPSLTKVKSIASRSKANSIIFTTNFLWEYIEKPEIDFAFNAKHYALANRDLSDIDDKGLYSHWRTHGIKEGRLTPNSFYRKPKKSKRINCVTGVNIFGPFSLMSGLGTSVRGYAAAMKTVGIKVKEVDVSGLIKKGETISYVTTEDLIYNANLFVLNVDRIDALLDVYGSNIFADKFNVGAFVWELPTPRPEWDKAYYLFDMAIAPSAFVADAFKNYSGLQVEVVPHAIDGNKQHCKTKAGEWYELINNQKKSGRVIVCFIADLTSGYERKGLDLVEKIIFEKHNSEEFHFVIKTHSGAFNKLKHLENISIIEDSLSDLEFLELKKIIDVYVSPHRSEGFGLNIFESIVQGIPTILSRHSGAIELLGKDYPYFIEGTLIDLKEDHGAYRKGSVWFEPSMDSLSGPPVSG